jgi:hypothetical protein
VSLFATCSKRDLSPETNKYMIFNVNGDEVTFKQCRLQLDLHSKESGLYVLEVVGADNWQYGRPVNVTHLAIAVSDLNPVDLNPYRGEVIKSPMVELMPATLYYRADAPDATYNSFSHPDSKSGTVQVSLSRIDTEKGIVEGTFDGMLYPIKGNGKALSITEGRFRTFMPKTK